MPETVKLPLLERMIPGGVTFGATYLVEFQPHSLWYESSLTLVAQAIRNGIYSEYSTRQHVPEAVREALSRLVGDVSLLERQGLLRIRDFFSVTTGLKESEDESKIDGSPDMFESFGKTTDLKVLKNSITAAIRRGDAKLMKVGIGVSDNASVSLQYNDEKTFIDTLRTGVIPTVRIVKLATFFSLATGIYSDSLYRQCEALCDGIFDFESKEAEGEMEHYMRVRLLREHEHNSQWHRLRLLETGEVRAEPAPAMRELGIGGWIRGSKKEHLS